LRNEYDDRVTFFNGFFPSPGAWDFRHIPAGNPRLIGAGGSGPPAQE
jgi:hypothetical protein